MIEHFQLKSAPESECLWPRNGECICLCLCKASDSSIYMFVLFAVDSIFCIVTVTRIQCIIKDIFNFCTIYLLVYLMDISHKAVSKECELDAKVHSTDSGLLEHCSRIMHLNMC